MTTATRKFRRKATLHGPVNLKATGGKQRRFKILAYTGGKLHLDGWDTPLVVDLSKLPTANTFPIVLDHEQSVEATLGQCQNVFNDGRKLVLTGPITGTSKRVRDVIDQADNGHQWQASIGALVTAGYDVPEGESTRVNGRVLAGPIFVATQARLIETSVLPIGADSNTVVNLAARAAQLKASAMTFEQWLANQGIDPATLSDADRATYMAQYNAEMSGGGSPASADDPDSTLDTDDVIGDDDDDSMTPDYATWLTAQGFDAATLNPQQAANMQLLYTELYGVQPDTSGVPAATGDSAVSAAAKVNLRASRKAASDEILRQGEIRTIARDFPKIAAAGITRGWTPKKTREKVMAAQAQRRAPAGHVRTKVLNNRIITAALCRSAMLPNIEKHFKSEELEIVDRDYKAFGLQELLITAAASAGYVGRAARGIDNGNFGEIMQYMAELSRPQFARASGIATTLDISGILSNVANKEILQGYQEEENTWQQIAVVKSVKDFKEVKSYRMTDNMEYKLIPPNGEIKHGSLGEESYSRSIKTYGRMFNLDRQAIINDDLGMLDDLRAILGRGAMLALNRIFWREWLSNKDSAGADFFSAGNGNIITGAGTALDEAGVGLQKAILQFSKMRTPSEDGKKIPALGRATILLVPPELQFAAERLYVNQNLGGGTTNANANIHANKYKPVVCPFLSDDDMPGKSSSKWYLLRDPGMLPGAVVSFLNGQQTPTVESSQTEFNMLGISFRGWHDFGVDLAEYLCGVQSAGTT